MDALLMSGEGAMSSCFVRCHRDDLGPMFEDLRRAARPGNL
jgi:hypothetical protein